MDFSKALMSVELSKLCDEEIGKYGSISMPLALDIIPSLAYIEKARGSHF
jgi:hypothetical protein